MVVVVAAIVVVIVVVRVLVWAAEISNVVVVVEVLVNDVDGVANILVGAIVIALKFVLPTSCSVDMSSSDVVVDLFMDALAGVMFAVLTGIWIDVLADVSANAFAVAVTALEFPVSTPLEGFSR